MLIPNIFPTNFISIVIISSAKYAEILEKDDRKQKNRHYFEIILETIQFAGKTNQMDFVALNLIAFSGSKNT